MLSGSSRFALKLINENYELWHDDKLDLDCIILREAALTKLAKIYKEKYGIDIAVVINDDKRKEDSDISLNIKSQLDALQPGEKKGLLYITQLMGGSSKYRFLGHVRPFILAKDQDGKVMVVNFEGEVVADETYVVRSVVNYDEMQSDSTSCGIFAINSIKNALMSEDFMHQVFDDELDEIMLSKRFLAQHSEDFATALPEDKKKSYVRKKEDGDEYANYKAFYKCHEALRKMLSPEEFSEYESKLNEKTKALIADIDEARKLRKSQLVLTSSEKIISDKFQALPIT